MRRAARCIVALLLLAGLTACGGDEGPVSVADVQVSAAGEVLLGDSIRATARVLDARGNALQGRTIAWSSSDAVVLQVAGGGESARVSGVRAGEADVIATVEGKTATHRVTVLNPAPVVDSIAPRAVSVGAAGVPIRVFGRSFQSTTRVHVNGAAQQTQVVSERELLLTLSAAQADQPGQLALTVLTPAPGGGTSAEHVLSIDYPVPGLSSLAPSSAVQGSAGLELTLNGIGFVPASRVHFGGEERTPTYVSAAQLRLTLTAADLAATRTVPVSVTNPAPGGGTSATLTFTVTDNPCTQPRPIQLGQTVTGTLSAASCRLSDGSLADVWTLTLAAAARVQIDLTSSAFDAYLAILHGSTLLDQDDDSGGGTNARLVVALDTGSYTIVATTFEPGQSGAYQLSVQTFDPCTALPLPINLHVGGFLTAQSCASGGFFEERWTFTLTSGRELHALLGLPGGTLTPVLQLSRDGTVIGEARAESVGDTAAIDSITLEPGVYTARVTTAAAGQTGQYRLHFGVVGDPCGDRRFINAGETLSGTLSSTSCTFADGTRVDLWGFTLSATTDVVIDLVSSAFNAFLLLAVGNHVVAQDDNGGGGTHARITRRLAAGTYVIAANTFGPGEAGAYQLSLRGTPASHVLARALFDQIIEWRPLRGKHSAAGQKLPRR